MPHFICRYKTAEGRTRRERFPAADEEAVRRAVVARGDFPLRITPTERIPGRERMSLRQAKEWAETLEMLLESGHTVTESMRLMQRFRKKGLLWKTARMIEEELDKGLSFRQALEAVPVRFPPGFVDFVGIGESVGSLSAVLNHVSEYYGRLGRLRERVGTAMIYPSLVLIVALAAGIFLSIVTLPSLRDMMVELSGFDASSNTAFSETSILPAFFYWAVGGAALLGLFLIILRRSRNEEGFSFSALVLRLPIIGSVITNWGLMSWSFSLELLTGQGVPMDRALDEAAGTVGNRYLKMRLGGLSSRLSKGGGLSNLLEQESDVPDIVPGWLAIGEETGNVARVFKTLREHFERRVMNFIEWATQLVEPVLILVIGLLMILLVGKYVLPVFRLMGSLL